MQQQAPLEATAVTKALRKKGGADEALRLVEHLPNRVALELLTQQTPNASKLLAIVLGAFSFSMLAFIVLIVATLFQIKWSVELRSILLLLVFCPLTLMMLAVILPHVRREKTRNEAVARYVATLFETDAVGLLLEYCGRETTSLLTREACWRNLSPLLVRLSEEEAAALSEKARAYLVLLIYGQQSSMPQLSSAEKTRVLLVLAAVRDKEFLSVLNYLRAFPSFREVADHLLLESPKS